MKNTIVKRLEDLERVAAEARALLTSVPEGAGGLIACRLAVAADDAASELRRLLDDLRAATTQRTPR